MSNVKEMRIFAAEQIEVPDEFPGILKNFVKEAIRSQPEELVSFSRQYFEDLLKARGYFDPPERTKLEFNPKEFYLNHKDNIKDNYQLLEVIGDGALSTVRRAIHIKSQITRAVKVVRKEDLEFGERRSLLEEIELLKELDHPNICRVIEMYEDKKKFYFINEMMYGGALYDSLAKSVGFTEITAVKIIRQLLSAITYLHSKNIVHRDIKPQNIHFKSNEDLTIKLLDFGSSRRMGENHSMKGVFGTSYYVAPEVIHGEYNEKCDVWSVGVILYMLMCGEPPFDGRTDVEVLEKIKKGEYNMDGEAWQDVSEEAKDLITKMLQPQDKRLSAPEAVQHPWFNLLKQDQEQDKEQSAKISRALYNLKNFNSTNKLKQAAIGFLVQHFMNMNEVLELEHVFQQLDTSGDGSLSKQELLEGYRKYYGNNMNESEVEALIEMADSSQDGVINYSEFMMTAVNREKFLTHERIEAVFNEIDIDNNNAVSLEELMTFLNTSQQLDQEAVAQAFAQVDPNNEGEIDLKQFKKLIESLLD